jgi:hypothetical protein
VSGVPRPLLATLVCSALLAAGGATADESPEPPPGSVVLIRGTAVSVVTPATFGSEPKVIRGAPPSARAADSPPEPNEGRIDEWRYTPVARVYYYPIAPHGRFGFHRHGHRPEHRAHGVQRSRGIGRR